MVIDSIASDPLVKRLIARIAATQEGVVHASGLWGSSAPMLSAMAAADSPRTFLYVTAHLDEADHARDDLELFLGRPCELFPAWEALPGEGPASGEVEVERLRLCGELARRRAGAEQPTIIVAPILALMQPVPSHDTLERNTLHLVVGATPPRTPSPEALAAWVVDRGFERLDLVESPGDVARRGDIVDLFIPGETHPYRIQFFGDTVESIRRFDVSTQRSIESLSDLSVGVMPKGEPTSRDDTTDFRAYLPADTMVILDEPAEIQEMGLLLENRLGVSNGLFEAREILGRYADFAQLHLSRFPPAAADGEAVFHFGVSALTRFEPDAAEAVVELGQIAQDHEVHVFCDNASERQRLTEMTREQTPATAERIKISLGVLHGGFDWTRTQTVVVAHHELFRRHHLRRRVHRVHAGRPLESWTDLKPGDRVVHVVHGIAIYRGLVKMRKGTSNQQEEFLTLEFADQAIVHVPCSQVDLVQKYIGMAGRQPQLSTLGGKRWNKTKQQVADAVSDLAESLLRIQAVRAQAVGVAYPADTEWQREFEASFHYDETEDQLTVAQEIREDLMSSGPMDRLICGDVGYGKTELAMRATFKVVEFGRQVAVLVPTTILAEQHYETFCERMAQYPFNIGCLSRFRSPSQQRKLIEQTRKGQVDVVIGTHRLLSKDVSFAN
ncbi:MAG: DEAD/DEAH box helicase, partial [Planctomycetes bacterium]|nr:DEAD/DEAH box helicase [Planctomycetota bacterium]